MSDGAAFLKWIPLVGTVLGDQLQTSRDQRQRLREAIAKLLLAVTETRAYAARSTPARETQREHGLARLWSEAAAAFYQVDGALAERLQLKAEYWTDPDAWTALQVRDAHISLDEVAARARQMLYAG
jgi:hypothetical protein